MDWSDFRTTATPRQRRAICRLVGTRPHLRHIVRQASTRKADRLTKLLVAIGQQPLILLSSGDSKCRFPNIFSFLGLIMYECYT